jgi:hypothetical protein
LGLNASATDAATAAAASARGCRFGRGRSFGLSFERLCSPGENKEKTRGSRRIVKASERERHKTEKIAVQGARVFAVHHGRKPVAQVKKERPWAIFPFSIFLSSRPLPA